MMGGNIKVKSELGKGSEITIGLRFKTTSATNGQLRQRGKDVADDRVAA